MSQRDMLTCEGSDDLNESTDNDDEDLSNRYEISWASGAVTLCAILLIAA
jgi:hypothetical protein